MTDGFSGTGAKAIFLRDEDATTRLAEDVAAVLMRGDIVALSGGLGAGKTTFARALIRALANDRALEVPSPTFPLRIDHGLRLRIAHVDLYRLGAEAELDELGLDEALEDGAVIVEWPDLLPSRLADARLEIRLDLSDGGRRATLVPGRSWVERLERSLIMRSLLERNGFVEASRTPLAGDASTRAFERIAGDEKRAILMNAPAKAEGPRIYEGRSYDALAHRALDVRPFIAIGGALHAAGIRTPEIYAADVEAGLILVEDLGDAGIAEPSGAPNIERYGAAVDLLLEMHSRRWPAEAPLPDGSSYTLPPYDREALLVEVSLFPDWFGGRGGEAAFPVERRADFLAGWSRLIERIDARSTTWVLRDFHSPNILWQEQESGIRRVGVIDFQDALIGHPAYDVASLAQDARMPIDAEAEAALKARYVAGRRLADPHFDIASFDVAYRILALQRATKVLGAFTRLALVEGKPGYQRHRGWLKALIRRNLADPVLSDMRVWYEPYL